MEKQWKQWETLFWGTPKSLQMVNAAMKLKDICILEGKATTNLDSLLKSRDVTLPTKFCIVKTVFFFSVVMYRCESWTIKKAECRMTDTFELWCWRRPIVPWAARRSKLCILKEFSPEHSLEELMLKLKLQYFVHWCKELTHQKRPRRWGKIRHQEKGMTEDEMVRWHQWLNWLEFEQAPGDGEGHESVAHCGPWGRKE